MAQLRMKVIIPKRINQTALLAELAGEMKAVQKEVGKDFGATVRTWDSRPKFNEEFENRPQRIRFLTGTSDKVYGYVSGGTKAHRIRPKRAKVLAFQGVYRAKTSPGAIDAKPGGSSGATVFSQGVRHPGAKARKFPEAIEKKWRRPFPNRIRAAMGRAAKKSGHSI